MVENKKIIQIVQIGNEDWSQLYCIPKQLTWTYLSPEDVSGFVKELQEQVAVREKDEKVRKEWQNGGMAQLPQSSPQFPIEYAALLLTGDGWPDELIELAPFFDVYRVFYEGRESLFSIAIRQFLMEKMAQSLEEVEPQEVIDRLEKALFSGQYGAKIQVSDMLVSPKFIGSVAYNGERRLELDGFYGSDYQQIAYSNHTLPFDKEQALDIFFEHNGEQGVETKILVRLIQEGSVSRVLKSWEFEGNDSRKEHQLSYPENGYLSISLFAKGKGRLEVGTCHYRLSRCGFGHFFLGGERFVDSQQDEFMYYFDPQDFQPPLCVYFSGWRTAEGFEGHGMMRGLKCPFLLICDPRLSGGAFYMGSEEFEQKIVDVILEKLDFLGFDNSQLILSGLSMGSFGAVYHGSKLSPHAIILGKPIFSLGEVALKEKIVRPGGFPTSLDLLRLFGAGWNQKAANDVDNRFWEQFDQADFLGSQFFIVYMKEDDYDATAFRKLIEHTEGRTREVVLRGITGRHNDQFAPLFKWFITQYQNVLRKDFGRRL